ncbi:MAG: hypothetical protein OXG83_02240 [Acidobacteria bacterium]|nr:hypothetical protein [Acidobacteriota bacterium]
MSKTSKPPSFADRLKEQTATDQEAIETYGRQMQDAAKEQLRELGETLRRYAGHELTQTTSAIRQQARRSIAAQWIRSLVIGLGVCMGIWSSLWAVGQWQHREIREKIELLDYLDQQIEDRNQTLDELSQEVE